MANLHELIDSAERKIRDSYYTRTILKDLFNQALREVAGIVPVPLPNLESTANLITSTTLSYVALPATASNCYQRDLTYCYSTAVDDGVDIVSSLEMLTVNDPSLALAGPVSVVAVAGLNLWYYMRPSVADTLRVHFYRKPILMSVETASDETGIPLCLPDHLHEKLLVNRVCEIVFGEIEQEVDDAQKQNTTHYGNKYKEALSELIYWIGPKKKRPVLVNDIISSEFE